MSSRPRILCTCELPPQAKGILAQAGEVDHHALDHEGLVRLIPSYDALWANFDVKVDRAVLERAERLKVINTATTGTDHLDKQEAARRGIRILSIARDYGLLDTFTATAELSWMLLLACFRHFRRANRQALAGDWGTRIVGEQLSGHTLGVLGVGRLGRMTAAYGKAFRMRVIGCDTDPAKFENLPPAAQGIQSVDFDTLLRESDAIALHIHLTPENRHLFNRETFAKMKPGVVLVNTSRGDLIDEEALLEVLEQGRLAAFGADVLHDEWRADMSTQPVLRYARDHENVVLSPHMGGATRQSIDDARIFSAKKLAHYLQTGEELTMP